MNVDLGIWDKLTRTVVFLLFVAGLLGVAIWYLPLIKANERMRRENLRLETQIRKEEEESKQLRASMEALRDPKVMERVVRERMGYGKPGETIIRFDPPKTNSAAH
ncbi:MAG: FtsB family cell division protein [Limisphaerales bacterium]